MEQINNNAMEYEFENYLLKRGYRPVTANAYRKLIVKYFKWCKSFNYKPNATTLEDLYEYKDYHLKRGVSVRATSQLLSVLKHYFMFTKREENPALLVKHKKQEKNLPRGLLSEEEIRMIFQEMNAHTLIQRRDKLMISMVLFQALKREELNNLQLEDLKLSEAKVYIRETSRTNSRILDLHPLQIH